MYKLVIYVHARNDVIRSTTVEIKVDLPITSGLVLKNTASDVASQIEKAFPLSQIRDVTTSLIPVLRQANVISESWLAGVVVKVPGTIEDRAVRTGSSPSNAAMVQSQLDQVQQQYEDLLLNARNKAIDLEVELDNARQLEKVLQARVERLQASEKRLRALRGETQSFRPLPDGIEEQFVTQAEQLAQLRKQVEELAENKGKLEVQLQQAQFQATEAERTVAILKTELDQLHQENASLGSDNKDLHRQLAKEQQQAKSAPQTVSKESQPASGDSVIIW